MRAALGSIERLEQGRYRIYMELGRKEDGRRKRVTKVVRGTRQDAEIELARMRLDAGKKVDAELTLSYFWAVYYEPTVRRLAETTQQGYRRSWVALVEPLFGDCDMGSLKARDIERKLLTIDKPGQQRNAYKLMRQMFNEAYRDEMIESNPFDRRIRLDRMPSYEPDILLLDDVPEWVATVAGQPWEPIVLTMLFAGLRREEATALFWEDITFGDVCSIRVDKTLTEVSGKVVEGPTKTPESERTVFLAGWPAERLRELRSTGPLYPDANGNRMAPDKVTRQYKAAFDKSCAKYVPPRNLRNSYATIMQGLGTSDSLISKSLGHTTIKTDYAHYFAANAPAHKANAQMLGESVSHTLSHGQ